MKKHLVIFQKLGKISVPVYGEQFQAMLADVKDKEFFQGVFSKPKKAKSCKQLGWLYGKKEKNGIYEFMVSQFSTYLYSVVKYGVTIEPQNNVTNVDIMMKELYCNYKGIKEFNKTNASTESLNDYIKFLDEFSIQNFGYELPLPKKQGD